MSETANQGGLIMAAKRSSAEMEQSRRDFLGRAAAAFEQILGVDGQSELVTLSGREDRAYEVTEVLARWLPQEHLGLDGAADPGAQLDCPLCGGGGPVRFAGASRA